ncbi:MAG: DUF4258 domain-containing protein [Dehalococcoidia bacterium]|nr:MAG: DUF4258 domain-containing protein [Dehalococcoidia bacterium]
MPSDPLNLIKTCIIQGKIIWTYHVNMRLKGRYISREAVLSSVDMFEVIEEYPEDKYLPSYLICAKHEHEIFHIQIAIDREDDNVRIITVYKPTMDKWQKGYKTRRQP